ncbi:MAG TPA: FG-GAP-like repeat-containing protein, partial [Verrucomicrobiota bacterium]|nr:FG-GAP-like repeat-containing protein [Verrucomicrobiota bacterium]
MVGLIGVLLSAGGSVLGQADTGLQQLRYRNPGLAVDLSVGLWAWPMPMDYDGDGDFDLLVSCPDRPSNGIYFFENPGGGGAMPVFKPGVRLGKGYRNIGVSRVDGSDRILIPGREFVGFRKKGFAKSVSLFSKGNIHLNNVRNNVWQFADYDGDDRFDLVIGVGDWSEYGWDNAYNEKGEWLNGSLHGHVYWMRNTGSNAKPFYASKQLVEAAGAAVDVYGWPTPNFADYDGDGDLDLVCGEFLDGLTYFENAGSRTQPRYLAGQRLLDADGAELKMDLQMIVPVAVDWDSDGDVDLIVGQEDGRVAFVEHTGRLAGGAPVFTSPRFLRQQAVGVKFGALSTPVAVDWDGDGDHDIVSGNTAGYIGFFENLGGGAKPRWAAAQRLKADGRVIRIQAGENGS